MRFLWKKQCWKRSSANDSPLNFTSWHRRKASQSKRWRQLVTKSGINSVTERIPPTSLPVLTKTVTAPGRQSPYVSPGWRYAKSRNSIRTIHDLRLATARQWYDQTGWPISQFYWLTTKRNDLVKRNFIFRTSILRKTKKRRREKKK